MVKCITTRSPPTIAGMLATQGAAFSNGIPPSETSKTITYDPTTDAFIYDVNTLAAIAKPRVAGYTAPSIFGEAGLVRESGFGTGRIRLEIVDPISILDGQPYNLTFEDSEALTTYTVVSAGAISTVLKASPGRSQTTGYRNLMAGTVEVRTEGGRQLIPGTDFTLNPAAGTIQIALSAGVSAGSEITVSFQYAPLFRSRYLQGEESNLVFDGMHLFVEDDPLEVDNEQSGWIGGGSVAFDILVATAGPGRVPQPSDYEVRFYDSNVGTSFSNELPIPFEVVNLTRANMPVDVFTPDINRNGRWDLGERIIFLETLDGTQTATWEVRLDEDGQQPGDGDVLIVATRKPFSGRDAFSFTTVGAATEPALTTQELPDIYVVPNPYVATTSFEPRNPIARTERGERRLYFANVPRQCTIRIYSLAGELVNTLYHDSSLDDGKLFWNMRTKDNMNLAYGLYIFHVDSPEGSFIGKFAVIK